MIIELKKAFHRPEIYVVILLGAAVAVFGLLEMTSEFYLTKRADRSYSAYQASMVLQGNVAEFFAIFLLPLFAVLPYSDSFFLEKRAGVHVTGLIRRGRFGYFMSMLCTAWTMAVAAILFTYVINQILCLIALPVERVVDMNDSRDIYLNDVSREVLVNPSMLLFLNNPLARNVLHMLYACYYGGSIAAFAFALTLYIYKNRALAIFLPITIIYITAIIGIMMFGSESVLPLGIVYGPNYWIPSFVPMILIIAIIYAGSIIAVLVRSFYIKDIL